MTKLNIGDRVRPVDHFDFEQYSGPANLKDRGTVVGFQEAVPEGGFTGSVLVKWDNGISGAFVEGSCDHTYAPDGLNGSPAWHDDVTAFGVVKVEADAE